MFKYLSTDIYESYLSGFKSYTLLTLFKISS